MKNVLNRFTKLKDKFIESRTYIFYQKIRIWIEILIIKILHKKLNNSIIPYGRYCYAKDEKRNKTHPIDGFWIKHCPYFRKINRELTSGCVYCGVVGFDMLLGDQCKICDENVMVDDE
jgi:hypothetical protein